MQNIYCLNWRKKWVDFLLVTPEMALAWLTHHNGQNRLQRKSVLGLYAGDMAAGRWKSTHQGIAFDWNGQLIDGQHRLKGIVDSNRSIELMVSTGWDPLIRADVDTHAKRSVADAFDLSGRSDRLVKGIGANTAAGMWQRMIDGLSGRKGTYSRAEVVQFSDRHAKAGKWALTAFAEYQRLQRIQTGPVIAAVARAYYHSDLERLEHFVRVLSTGIVRHPDDETAVYWRNALISTRMVGNSNRSPELYGKTCRAILAFCAYKRLNRFYVPDKEPYPLPEHQEFAASA